MAGKFVNCTVTVTVGKSGWPCIDGWLFLCFTCGLWGSEMKNCDNLWSAEFRQTMDWRTRTFGPKMCVCGRDIKGCLQDDIWDHIYRHKHCIKYSHASLNDGDTFWKTRRYAISSLCERHTVCKIYRGFSLYHYNFFIYNWIVYIQGVPGGTDNTSGECSLGQTIPI
jgi:hypothetical protein